MAMITTSVNRAAAYKSKKGGKVKCQESKQSSSNFLPQNQINN